MRHQRAGSEPYYEDVDPRFAVEAPSDDGSYPHHSGIPNALTPGGAMTPGALTQTIPGGFPSTPGPQQQPQTSYMQQQYRTQSPPQVNPDYLHPTSYTGGGSAVAPHMASSANPSLSDSDPHLDPNHVLAVGDSSSQENLPDGARSPNGGGSERASEASHFTSISERPVNPNWRGPDGGGGYGPHGGAYRPQQQPRREDVILGANPDFSIPGMGPARGGGRPGRLGGAGAAATSQGVVPGGRYPTDI